MCFSQWVCKESDMTQQWNNTNRCHNDITWRGLVVSTCVWKCGGEAQKRSGTRLIFMEQLWNSRRFGSSEDREEPSHGADWRSTEVRTRSQAGNWRQQH